ncbi:hypothetical protein DQQ10_16665 [Pseudochryseolinea flava]|uniref:Uncharacterized protein n=1 Tax=Pseudochryseolinea flava TaxID=2059302 RepID=A0A364Y368_9BACT|nr:hypothetical protein DQQ10_16665 [Pseudochryseolinea flava]
MVLAICFFICIVGQIYTGHKEYNDELQEHNAMAVTLSTYLQSGHFFQTTFENWESEFLQMGMYVLLTVALRQKGSSESKDLDKKEEVDRAPDPNRKDAPWPVKRGGFVLTIYRNSLSLAFIILFLSSFALHACGSFKNYNEEQLLKGDPQSSFGQFMSSSRFWFESFQNWQSEFVAVISIVVLSIFLRQYGSPESKPVDASMSETGS